MHVQTFHIEARRSEEQRHTHIHTTPAGDKTESSVLRRFDGADGAKCKT